jgi:membrane protein required for colicin V production|tara:strand:+ start:335 stop:922 length:588 start_codon:yes stop_codon:yes gene_type:complete
MESLGFNFIDWTIIIVLTTSVVLSVIRGFVKEFLSLSLWIAAFFVSVNYEYLATPQINEFIGNADISKIIAYVCVFTVFIFIGGLIIKLISRFVKWSGASGFDRLLGMIFGLTRGFLILFVVFLLLPTSAKSNELMTSSKLAPVVVKYAPQIEKFFKKLIDNRGEIVDDTIKSFNPMTNKEVPEKSEEVKQLGDS